MAVVATSGCLMARYVSQAGHGQFELLASARPIEDVVKDPRTPPATAALLGQIPEIKGFGRGHGLSIRRNYSTYVDLGRPAAVWFVGAADPIAFRPVNWCFPIAGCFAGLGWFDLDDAIWHRNELEARGYDVILRPASAYSTGGWFPDPVLSTMLGTGDDAFPALANLVLHESVHATVLVPDQAFFNESFATYVADVLTDQWIRVHFGTGSREELAWTMAKAIQLARTARLLDTYNKLKAHYRSGASRADKLAAKTKLIDELVEDLRLFRRPNNASLTETRVYNGGVDALLAAHRACGDVRKLVLAGRSLTRRDFASRLQEDLAPIGRVLAERCRRSKR